MQSIEVRCNLHSSAGEEEGPRLRQKCQADCEAGLHSGWVTAVAGALLGLCVSACGSSPDMAPVKAMQVRAVHNTDDFMAVAATHTRYAAGGGNVLLRSSDGRTWVRQDLPRASSIIAMTTCPDGSIVALDFRNKVWVLGASVSDWIAHRLTDRFQPMDVACAADGRLWAVGGDSTIESSTDGGQTWKIAHQGEDAFLRVVRFIDAEHGYVAGEFGTFLVTEDGGQTWIARPGLPKEFYPFSMVFTDFKTGWISGPAGVLYHTADAGQTWTKQVNPTGMPVYSLFRRGGQALGVGEAGQLLMASSTGWAQIANVPRQRVPVMGAVPVADGWLMSGPAGFVSVVEADESVAAPVVDGAKS